jgi:hypothetical protein
MLRTIHIADVRKAKEITREVKLKTSSERISELEIILI